MNYIAEVFQTLTPDDKVSETLGAKADNPKKQEVSKSQIIIGAIIILFTGLIIFSIFKGGDTTPVETVTEEVKTDQPAKEPIIQIVTLYNIPMSKLSEQFATPLNSVGNLIVDTNEYKLLIESKGGVNSDYVEVQLKSLGSCTKTGAVRNSDKAFELVGLKPDLKGNPTNPPAGISNGAVEYCEYPNSKFSVGTSCMYDGGYYDVSLSPRTYCGN